MISACAVLRSCWLSPLRLWKWETANNNFQLPGCRHRKRSNRFVILGGPGVIPLLCGQPMIDNRLGNAIHSGSELVIMAYPRMVHVEEAEYE
jgi:hypothetical protein